MGLEEDRHDEAIAGLYEAALAPERWHAALMQATQQVGADTFHFLTWDRHDATTAFNLYSHEWMAAKVGDYASYYGAIDPRRQLLETLPVGTVLACHRHFSEEAVGRDEFYQDFFIPGGMRYITMARLQDDERRYTLMGLMREVGNRPFDDAELAGAQRVMTHLGRACRLWSDTQQQRAAAAAGAHAAQASGFALFAVDAAGRIAYANANAERLLAEGGCLVSRGGRIGAACSDDDARLRQLVREVHASGCGISLALSGLRDPADAVLLNIAPLAPSRAGDLAGALVLITARARRQPMRPSARALTETFGLSSAESAVALALCDGKTPDEHAQASGVSVATVRTQLRAVFEKTQTRRQAETVRLLLGMPAENG